MALHGAPLLWRLFRPFKIASKVVTLDRPVSAFDFIKMVIGDMGFLLPALAVLGFFRVKRMRTDG